LNLVTVGHIDEGKKSNRIARVFLREKTNPNVTQTQCTKEINTVACDG